MLVTQTCVGFKGVNGAILLFHFRAISKLSRCIKRLVLISCYTYRITRANRKLQKVCSQSHLWTVFMCNRTSVYLCHMWTQGVGTLSRPNNNSWDNREKPVCFQALAPSGRSYFWDFFFFFFLVTYPNSL